MENGLSSEQMENLRDALALMVGIAPRSCPVPGAPAADPGRPVSLGAAPAAYLRVMKVFISSIIGAVQSIGGFETYRAAYSLVKDHTCAR